MIGIAAFTLEQQKIALFSCAFVGLMVFSRVLAAIRRDGVKTRPDLFVMPEILATAFLVVMMVILAVGVHLRAGGPPATSAAGSFTVENILSGSLTYVMYALAVPLLIISRGGSARSIFGLGKMPVFRALFTGVGLGFCAIPLVFVAKFITTLIIGTAEPNQVLVQRFSSALHSGDTGIIAAIVVSAGIIAPVSEELLFRGTFYPVLSRATGRIVSAILTALLFGAVHDTRTDLPGLALLALCLSIAYERTGSILVPILMHLTFNCSSLAAMWLSGGPEIFK